MDKTESASSPEANTTDNLLRHLGKILVGWERLNVL